jgi:hypothetical protein
MRHVGVLLPVVFAFLVGAAPASAWTWPVEGPVMQPFSFEGDPYAGGQHRGIDVGAASNDPVRAPAAGLVSFAGSVPRGGLTVTIRTGDGYAVTLVHLGTVAVGKGQQVLEGQVIGAVGPSGEAEQPSPYVHLGARVAADEHGYVDPLTLLPARPGESGAPADAAQADGAAATETAGATEQQHSTGAEPDHPSTAAQTDVPGEPGANAPPPAPSQSAPETVSASSATGVGAEQTQTPPEAGAGTVVSDQGGGEAVQAAGSVRGSSGSAGGGVVTVSGATLPAVGAMPVRAAHPPDSPGAVQDAPVTRPDRDSRPDKGAESRQRAIATRHGGRRTPPRATTPAPSPAASIRSRDRTLRTVSAAGDVGSAAETNPRRVGLGKAAALAAVLAGAALLLWRSGGGARPAPAVDPARGSPGGVREAGGLVERPVEDRPGIEIDPELDSAASRARSREPVRATAQAPGIRLSSVDDLARAA